MGSHRPHQTLSSKALLVSSAPFNTGFHLLFSSLHAETMKKEIVILLLNHGNYNSKASLIIVRASLFSAQCSWGKSDFVVRILAAPNHFPTFAGTQKNRCRWCSQKKKRCRGANPPPPGSREALRLVQGRLRTDGQCGLSPSTSLARLSSAV